MATTTTMGQPTRTTNKVWWAIAIVAAILIVMALIGRRDNATGTQGMTQGTMDPSTVNTQTTDTPSVPAGTNTNATPAPTIPTNTVPNQ